MDENVFWRTHNFYITNDEQYMKIFLNVASARKTSDQYHRIFVPLTVSLWNYLNDPVFDGVGHVGFKSRANECLLGGLICSFFSFPTILAF